MAVGNTFGATALSSYGGFWLAFAIVLTPGGFEIEEELGATSSDPSKFYNSMGLFLMVCSSPYIMCISRPQC
jgi:succinate-acetate transporter protein